MHGIEKWPGRETKQLTKAVSNVLLGVEAKIIRSVQDESKEFIQGDPTMCPGNITSINNSLASISQIAE